MSWRCLIRRTNRGLFRYLIINFARSFWHFVKDSNAVLNDNLCFCSPFCSKGRSTFCSTFCSTFRSTFWSTMLCSTLFSIFWMFLCSRRVIDWAWTTKKAIEIIVEIFIFSCVCAEPFEVIDDSLNFFINSSGDVSNASKRYNRTIWWKFGNRVWSTQKLKRSTANHTLDASSLPLIYHKLSTQEP